MRDAQIVRSSRASFAAIRRLFPVLLAVIVFLCGGRALLAQATGSISGVATDPGGQVVPGVKIEVTSLATSQTRTITSGGDGSYQLPLVNPGIYKVKATASGFKTTNFERVEVVVNGTTRLDVHLSVGGVVEEVTVSDITPLVETGNATLGNVVNHEAIVDLPLNGRSFAQLGTLIPGVIAAPAALGGATGNATPGGFGNSTGSFNVNGMRNQSNSFLLDGAPNNDSFNSGFVMRPPPDAIEEFKIMTHSYDAQYGRSAGAIVNVVTRAGTNTWHGSAWEFNRVAALAAKTYFMPSTQAKPAYQQNQFGGTLGGKLIRDRLFVFGFYEGFRLKDATSNTLNVPVLTAAQRQGNFSSSSAIIRDPLTGAQFNYNGVANQINPSRISSVSQYLLTNYVPLPNSANGYYVSSPANIDNRNMAGLRADLKLGSHSLFGRYIYNHTNLLSPLTPSSFSPSGNRQIMNLQDAMISDTWLVTPQLINVARYARQWIFGKPYATSGISPSAAGYSYSSSNPQAMGLPYVSITGYFTQGDAQQPFAYRGNGVDTISDDITWSKGKHTFQFGGEARRETIKLLYINRPNGNFTFTSNFTGNALADFLLGYPYTFQQGSGDPAMSGVSWNFSGYAQDQYRVNPHLTLTLGGRYEVNKPYTEANGHLAALHPGQQSTVQPNAPLGLVYPGDVNTPAATYYADTNNISPRVGAIYDPAGDGKTVLRVGWGIYFDTIPGQGDFFQNGTLAPPFQPLQQIDFYTRASTSATSQWFASPYTGVAAGAAGFPAGLTFIGWSLPHSYKAANIQHYNLGVEHQFTQRIGFELAYAGTRAKQLPIFIEVNPTNVVASTSATSAYAASTRAVFPAFGLTRPTFSAAKSWYDSLQARLTLRNWHHATATAAYTWSRSIDDVSGLNIGNDSRPILPVTIGDNDSIDRALERERGNSLFDTRNRFVLSFGYELPKLISKPAVERLLVGGWQLNGIFQVQSGNPFTAVNASNTAQSLTFRPNMTCNPNNFAGRNVGTSSTFINTSCFSLPMIGSRVDNRQSGNEPRGVILGPGFNTTDASIFKIFRITETQHADFRFEVFNVFNEARFAQPNLSFTADSTGNVLQSSAFGRITATTGNDSRVIQLAFKYGF